MSDHRPARTNVRRNIFSIALLTMALASSSFGATPPVKVTTLAPDLDGAVGGVAVDALGYVYVADFGETVWKIDPWGNVEVLADSLYGSSGNAIDLEGNLLQSNFNANTISKITRSGEVSTFASGLAGPVGVAVAPDGNVYVCNCRSNVISRIDSAGARTEFAKGDLFNCPNGITIGADGSINVVNFSDGRMIQITPEGEASHFATIPGGGNGHIAAVGPDYYVTGFRASRIYRVSADGEVSTAAGNGRFGELDGEGLDTQFSSPNGIAYDARRDVLYTNDYLIPWTVRFQFTTPPKSSVRKVALPSLQEHAAAAFAEGVNAGKEAIRAYRVSRPARLNQLTINGLGYQFLQGGKTPEAIAIFELATEFYPAAFNLWDSLGEAHKAAGHRDDAIKYYKKSLELNPENANATAMLKELSAE